VTVAQKKSALFALSALSKQVQNANPELLPALYRKKGVKVIFSAAVRWASAL
jgi:hypothetical protein